MSKKKTPAATPAKPKAAKKAATAPHGADVAPAKGKSATKSTPVAKAPKAALVETAFVEPQIESVPETTRTAKDIVGSVKGKLTVKKLEAAIDKAAAPAKENKGAKILALISRPDGATLAEIMEATAWQKHSVRGFISTAGKKLTIESSKSAAGERTYRIAK